MKTRLPLNCFVWLLSLTAMSFAQNSETPPVAVESTYSIHDNGITGELSVTARIRDGYHIYAMTQPKPFLATQIDVPSNGQFQLTSKFQPVRAPKIHFHEDFAAELHDYEGAITWRAQFQLSPGVSPDQLQINGTLNAQACFESGCTPPTDYAFASQFTQSPRTSDNSALLRLPNVSLPVAATPVNRNKSALSLPAEFSLPSEIPLSAPAVSDSSFPEAAPSTDHENASELTPVAATTLNLDQLEVDGSSSADMPLYWILPMALAAGFILNFMPCVLPVIGLKIMSFAQQAGDNRGRVFVLNLWYSLGLISVFLVLATLAVFLGYGWGQQFSSAGFNIVLASIVFVFALSFLGVWEIPIPGFVGNSGANDLAQREGATGAFSKGVLTTLLATPCSGPLLGAVLTWAVVQPPLLTYLVFAFVGLGMASPYLIVGAFPQLVGFLPKPGAWMNTFKHAMGFVLLATVAYLMSFMPVPYVVPMVAFMIGLGAACWWVGQISPSANADAKINGWVQAIAVATFAGFLAFSWLHGVMEHRFDGAIDRALAERGAAPEFAWQVSHESSVELPWQPYSAELLQRYTAERKTVFVDFTADWCLTCKSNELASINKAETRQFVVEHDIITLKADKTRPAPEVDALLKQLGNSAASIPYYAIFPANNPNRPVTIDGILTSPKPIIDALRDSTRPAISNGFDGWQR